MTRSRRDDGPGGLQRFFQEAGLPAFCLSLVATYEALLGAVFWLPQGDGRLAAFAQEFRIWCFGLDPATGSLDPAYVGAMFGPPLLLAAIVTALWGSPLRRALDRPAALARPAAAGAALVAIAAAGLSILGQPPRTGPLPFPAQALRTARPAPALQLTNQAGQSVDLAAEKGRVVVLTAVYASCAHTCPAILEQARRSIASLSPVLIGDLSVIAVTLDPERDTPSALAALAARHGLEVPLYNLVTGQPEEVNRVLDRLGIERHRDPATGVISHPNLFLLVDRSGRVAYRLGLGQRNERWLTQALEILLNETPSDGPGVG